MLSQFETLLAGSGLTVAGGFLATLLQMWYKRTSAREIRHDERSELALIGLNELTTIRYGQLLELYRRAEHGQNAAQHNEARQAIDAVTQHWDSRASGIVRSPSILAAYGHFNVAVNEGLPSANTLQRVQELSSGDPDVGKRFLRDLGRVVGTLDELRKAIHEQVTLLDHQPPRQRVLHGLRKARPAPKRGKIRVPIP